MLATNAPQVPVPRPADLDWLDAGDSLAVLGDLRLAEDDFDGSCRCYLVAAWCFAEASRCGQDADGTARASYHYALSAGCGLLPLTPESGSSASSNTDGSGAVPSRSPERHSRP